MIETRLDLFDNLRPGAVCIEVGTFAGAFALEIKKAFPHVNLACVDNWAPPHFDKLRVIALANLRGVVTIIDKSSVEAAASLPREIADVIYIDGAHDQKSVAADLDAWWPVLKPGGLFSGHDYFMRPAPGGDLAFWGPVEVPLAVDPWAKAQGLIITTTTVDNPPSWFVRKS